MLYANPNRKAPEIQMDKQNRNTLELKADFKSTRFDILVAGPDIKKAKTAPLLIPRSANC